MTRLKPPFVVLALAGTLTPAMAGAAQRGSSPPGPNPQGLWEAWKDGRTGRLATCVPKSACPPLDQARRKVQKCWYESDFRTGFRCILFCDYGAAAPWGSDGGSHCD